MIAKPMGEVTKEDIHRLQEEHIPEGKSLEYKRMLPNDGKNKKSVLKAIVAFANTEGGDLVIGMEEKGDGYCRIKGVGEVHDDEEWLALQQKIDSFIEPRVDVTHQWVVCEEGKKVLVVRVSPGEQAPHRVNLKNYKEFFKRRDGQSTALTLDEVRSMFLFTHSIQERMETFRKERVTAIKAGEAPVPAGRTECFSSVHIVPAGAYRGTTHTFSKEMLGKIQDGRYRDTFSPPILDNLPLTHWVNFRGVAARASGAHGSSYVQLYREGIIEGMENVHLPFLHGDTPTQAMYTWECVILTFIRAQIRLLMEWGMTPPFYVFISLAGLEGVCLAKTGDSTFGDKSFPIPHNELLLPVMYVEDPSVRSLDQLLKPIFDMVWQASGILESPNFTPEGYFLYRDTL